MGTFWDEIGDNMEDKNYSRIEALLSILYFNLITKEKYKTMNIPLLCADLYVFSNIDNL